MLDDADVKNAIGMIGSVWTFHSGQICTAPTRAIVHRSIYDHVVEGLAKMATVLKVGDPLEKDTVIGPVITEAHRARIEGYIAVGPGRGRRDRRRRRPARAPGQGLVRRADADRRRPRRT